MLPIVVVVFLNSLLIANRQNFNSKQRNSDSQDGVCQLLPPVPRRMLVHVRKLCTCLQGSHRIQRAISRDTLYQTSLLIGRYGHAQKNNEKCLQNVFLAAIFVLSNRRKRDHFQWRKTNPSSKVGFRRYVKTEPFLMHQNFNLATKPGGTRQSKFIIHYSTLM